MILAIPVLVVAAFIAYGIAGGNSQLGNNGRSLVGHGSAVDSVFRNIETGQLQGEVDQLLSKYTMALESEECMDRIICELGVKAAALPSKELFFR